MIYCTIYLPLHLQTTTGFSKSIFQCGLCCNKKFTMAINSLFREPEFLHQKNSLLQRLMNKLLEVTQTSEMLSEGKGIENINNSVCFYNSCSIYIRLL